MNDLLRPLNIGIPEAARVLGVGRSSIYELLKAGRLASVRIGTRRLITVTSLEALSANLAGGEG